MQKTTTMLLPPVQPTSFKGQAIDTGSRASGGSRDPACQAQNYGQKKTHNAGNLPALLQGPPQLTKNSRVSDYACNWRHWDRPLHQWDPWFKCILLLGKKARHAERSEAEMVGPGAWQQSLAVVRPGDSAAGNTFAVQCSSVLQDLNTSKF